MYSLLTMKTYVYVLPGVKKVTNTNADIIFLIDTSYIVGPHGYQTQINFVRSLARYLNVKPGQSRAAVISYGNKATKAFGFLEYKSLPEFERLLERVPPVGGLRNVKTAVDHAVLLVKKTRADKKRIVVLLIAGQQPGYKKSINASLQDIHSAGAQLFVISIDKVIAQHGQDPSNIFKVGSFDLLYPRSYPIARDISRAPGK